MQRRRAGRQSDRIALTHVGTHRFFKFVNILAQRRDPVLPKCVVNVLQFIALVRHVRAGQQKSFIHVLLLCFRPPDAQICFGRAYSLQKRDKSAPFLFAAVTCRNAQVHRSMYIAVSHPKNVGITPFLFLNYTTYGQKTQCLTRAKKWSGFPCQIIFRLHILNLHDTMLFNK